MSDAPPVPTQPPGIQFEITPDGFDIAPSPPTISDLANKTIQTLHGHILRGVQRTLPHLCDMEKRAPELAFIFQTYAEFLPKDLHELNVPAIKAVGSAFIGATRALPYDCGLEPAVVAQLKTIADVHTAWIGEFSNG